MKTLSEYKAQLEQEKIRLRELLTRTHDHLIKSESVSADFAEQANETNNDQVVEALDFEAKLELVQINKALQRIDDGSFGRCETCEKDIREKRLQAIPFVANCITCATELEQAND